MKNNLTIIIFFTIQFVANCQDINYYDYHDYINKAEQHYFIDNNVDSSLYYYQKAFAEFDYVFVKDPLIAAQVAFYNNKPFEEYLFKGFKVGLRIEHLSEIKLFEPIYDKLNLNETLQAEYRKRRKLYLESIDFSYRLQMSKMFIADQKDKHKNDYERIKFDKMGELLKLINSKGFPGAKIIGIDDNKMFSEIGKPEFEADSIFKKYGKDLKHLPYLSLDEETLSTKFIMVILFHNKCSYSELEKSIDNLIARGEVHPREIGIIYDNMFINNRNVKFQCKRPDQDSVVLRLNPFGNYAPVNNIQEKVDSLRKSWHIVPLSVDMAKKYYEKEFGFKLSFGFWGCM
jgi:hypothetical protein